MGQILEDLASSYLPSAGLSLTFGTNLFAGIMPNAPDACVALFEYPGAAPELAFNSQTPVFSHPHIQLMVRVTEGNYLAGRQQIEDIIKKLEQAGTNATLNGTRYYEITRLQDPFLLHRDSTRRIFFCCNFEVTKALG